MRSAAVVGHGLLPAVVGWEQGTLAVVGPFAFFILLAKN